MVAPSVWVAFVAGLFSFLSPCILPIIPGFIAYISGTQLSDSGKSARLKIFLCSVFFVLGFSVVFALLGVLLNSVLSGVSYSVQTWLGRIGGVIIIVFGLHLTGLIRIHFLQRDHRIAVKRSEKVTYVTSFLFGASFAVGWSPCVGAILGSILTLAAVSPGVAFWLLLSYAIGLGIPFLLVGIFANQFLSLLRRFNKLLAYFNIVVGVILILLGILVFTNNLILVANIFNPLLMLFGGT